MRERNGVSGLWTVPLFNSKSRPTGRLCGSIGLFVQISDLLLQMPLNVQSPRDRNALSTLRIDRGGARFSRGRPASQRPGMFSLTDAQAAEDGTAGARGGPAPGVPRFQTTGGTLAWRPRRGDVTPAQRRRRRVAAPAQVSRDS